MSNFEIALFFLMYEPTSVSLFGMLFRMSVLNEHFFGFPTDINTLLSIHFKMIDKCWRFKDIVCNVDAAGA